MLWNKADARNRRTGNIICEKSVYLVKCNQEGNEKRTMPKSSEAQKRASRKYDDANTERIYIKLNRNTDADILKHMKTVGNKQGYIKDLIRKEIKQDE